MTLRRHRVHSILATLTAALVLATPASSGAALPAGEPDYVIRVGASEGPVVRHAAQELASYLGQITGAVFPVVDDSSPLSKPSLVVGENNAFAAQLCPQLATQTLSDDGFVHCRTGTPGNHWVVAGHHPRGTLYAVNWLLDRELGVRWWGANHTFVPQRTSIVLPLGAGMTVHEPRFTYREIFSQDSEDPAYRQHNLLNGSSHHRRNLSVPPELNTWSNEFADNHHNFTKAVPDAAYHAGGQLAAMHGQTRAIAANYFTNRLTTDPTQLARYQSFSQQDSGWSPDPASQAFADLHGGAQSAPIIDMVTDVAARTRVTHPNARFATLAYQWSFPPPQGITVPAHIQMVVAPIHADFAQDRTGTGTNAQIAQDIAAWSSMAQNVAVWDYLTNYGGYIQPLPNLDGLFQTIQGLAGHANVRSYFGQDSYNTVGVPFAELRAWVSARLLWNPSQDYQALVTEFVNGYYRAAAPHISQYLNLLQDSVQATGTRLGVQVPVTAGYLTFDTVRAADTLFVQAEAAVAGDPVARLHVQTARIGVDYVILLRRAQYAAEAAARGIGWNPDTAARLARFKAYIAQTGMTKYGEGVGSLDELYATMEIERTVAPAPDFVAGLAASQWRDFSDLSLSRFGATLVPDSPASDGVAVRLRGDTNVWGIQIRSGVLGELIPVGGSWKLYAIARVDPGTGAPTATAFTVGVWPPGGTRNVTVGEAADGNYHAFEVPGIYQHGTAGGLYFAPPNSTAIGALYVDRVIAVNVTAQQLATAKAESGSLRAYTITQRDTGNLTTTQANHLLDEVDTLTGQVDAARNAQAAGNDTVALTKIHDGLSTVDRIHAWVSAEQAAGRLAAGIAGEYLNRLGVNSVLRIGLSDASAGLLNLTMSVTKVSDVPAGGKGRVKVTARNNGTRTVDNVAVALNVPAGWTATGVGPPPATVLGPGQQAVREFDVAAPLAAPVASNVGLIADLRYKYGAGKAKVSHGGSINVVSPIALVSATSARQFLAATGDSTTVTVQVRNTLTTTLTGQVSLATGQAGWTVTGPPKPYSLAGGAQATLTFTVTSPTAGTSTAVFTATAGYTGGTGTATARTGITTKPADAVPSWEFNTDGDAQSWVNRYGLAAFTVAAGNLHTRSTAGVGGYMIYKCPPPGSEWCNPLFIDASKGFTVQIRMKQSRPTWGRLFWSSTVDPTFGHPSQYAAFDILGGWQTYNFTIPPQSSPLTALRLDPANSAGIDIDIDYIRLIPGTTVYANDMETAPTFGGTLSTEQAHAGVKSEKMPANGAGVWSVISKPLPASPVSSFTYKLWVFDANSPAQIYRLGVQFRKPDGTLSPVTEPDWVHAGSAWTEISADFKDLVNTRISEGYTELFRISVRAYTPQSYVPYYIDDVSIMKQ